VLARTADSRWLPKVATTSILAGGDFPVIWVETAGHEPVPWPAEDVVIAPIDAEPVHGIWGYGWQPESD